MNDGENRAFERNWMSREESFYVHWTREEPENQVQLAFRNHWEVFQEIMANPRFNKGKRCLEIGCGRGSMSCYFSDTGYECSLLDISPTVIDTARKIYADQGLKATFYVGNANHLAFGDQTFDVTFSIGLMEHLEEPKYAIAEQIRVLVPGGLFLAYIVPDNPSSIQKEFEWINDILKGYMVRSMANAQTKADIFRTDRNSEYYLPLLAENGLFEIGVSGMYPIPMISHSVQFPFTIMPTISERALLQHFQKVLKDRRMKTGRHPWLCDENQGQAFLVWGFKE